MPKLGESVTEGTIGRWLKQIGDLVELYEPIAEVITDKVNAEIPSEVAGTLTEIYVKENDTVPVGTLIALIREAGESSDRKDPPVTKSSEATAVSAVPDAAANVHSLDQDAEQRGRYSPAVLRLAQENNVALDTLRGTGLGGRITRKDVLLAVEKGVQGSNAELAIRPSEHVAGAARNDSKSDANEMKPHASAQSTPAQPLRASSFLGTRDVSMPITPIRRTIATRMKQSKHEIPHAWMMVEADVTGMHQLRARHKAAFREREGIELTYFPFFLRAVAEALKAYPLVNSEWTDDAILVRGDIHLSIAVATSDALVVPVIHNADQLTVAGLAHAVSDLAARARSNRLTLDDVKGGTFTVNNTGAFGSIQSQPIINAPQAAILSVESIVQRPVIRDGDSIAIRSMVNLCMSLDHRVLDGFIVGQFMKSVKQRVEAYTVNSDF